MPASRLHPETLAPSMDLARRSSLSSHHLTLASVLAGEMCEHCHKEASGGIDLLTLIRYVEQGCSYYRIVLSAVDWAVPTLFTYDDIKLIFGFKLHRIHVSRRSDRKWAERVSLTVFRIPDSQTPTFPCSLELSEKLPGTTSSESTFVKIRDWLADCTADHPGCSGKKSSLSHDNLAGIRFVKLESSSLHLVEDSRPTRYACLSHCWGSGKALSRTKTTRKTLKTHKEEGISLNSLPKTFRDAVEICQRLKINHIWIDSLCIIQDDDSDWRSQAVRMSDIYQNGLITIAASGASDSAKGIFVETHQSYRGEPLTGHPGLYVRRTLPNPNSHVPAVVKAEWPLFTRGWVFQELTLSPRIIHFGPQDVGWQCQHKCERQCEPGAAWFIHEELHFPGFSAGSHENLVSQWQHAVAAYAWRDLTYQKDRLPAIAALAKQMQDLRPSDDYVAGLWESSLMFDLFWYTLKASPMDLTQFVSRARSLVPDDTRSIPTWSWASVPGSVYWSSSSPNPEPIRGVEILKIHHEFDGASVSGFIKQATLTIRAPLIDIADIESYHRYPDLSVVKNQNPDPPYPNSLAFLTVSIDDVGCISMDDTHPISTYTAHLPNPVFALFLSIPTDADEAFNKMPEALLVTKQRGSENMVRLGYACVVPLGYADMIFGSGGSERAHQSKPARTYAQRRSILKGYRDRFVQKLENTEKQTITLV